jgi:uncharacterized protein (TIGR03435 family)
MTRYVALAISLTIPLQIYAQAPAFDVVSVKTNKQNPRERHIEFGCSPNGRFVSLGQGLRTTVFWAYHIKFGQQMVGLPQWVDGNDAIFDIEAKAEGAITDDQCRLMAQKLLGDRFKMAAHRETKPMPVYALIVARNGPKFNRAMDTDKGSGVNIVLNGTPVRIGGPDPNPKGWPMENLAKFLTAGPFLDRPVIDQTGLEGLYRISFSFATRRVREPTTDNADSSDIFTAVQQDLGLKLEERNEPTEMLMIDHLERPDAN